MSTFVRRAGAWIAPLLLALLASGTAAAGAATAVGGGPPPPTVVFLLLDTTRADRLGAWGHGAARTPVLDGLAARGIRFARHYANSHATRPSMPQLMSGRYYHRNILREFEPDRHPREFPFLRADPSAVLLPGVLADGGYQVLGVSTHPWVVADSEFGRGFERLDLVTAEPARGHSDASAAIERALAIWQSRDRARPTFLYVHLMDLHMPRFVPAGAAMPVIPGYDPAARFKPNGEPSFDPRRRRWDRTDAGDFTDNDRRWFAAVYDANLTFLDRQVGRLLDAVLGADPDLARTLVFVTADHGEELGEDGRTDHGDSLADGVQHVPWIVAGSGLPAGRVVDRFSEHVDVLPTLLGRLDLRPPASARFDGVDRLDREGRPCAACGTLAVHYAWEDYRAVRTRRHLLRESRPASFRARCDGLTRLYAATPERLVPADDPARQHRLGHQLRRRLDPPLRRWEALGWEAPSRSFTWPVRFWAIAGDAPVACVAVGPDTSRAALAASGWLWSGRGAVVLHAGEVRPLEVRLPAPEGEYRIDAATVALEPMPWLFGFGRWARKSFLPTQPSGWVPLGTRRAEGGAVTVPLAEVAGRDRHVLGLRLTPAGVTPGAAAGPGDDPGLRRRLEALGYVQ